MFEATRALSPSQLFVVLTSAVCMLSGCTQQPASQPSTEAVSSPDAPSPTTPPSTPAEEPSITVQLGSWDDVQTLVAENAGRVVVVDLWSTSCVPCIAELPHLGRLHRESSDDVACISLSVDYYGAASKPPESYRERVEEVLNRCEVSGRNFLCTEEADVLFDRLKLPSIPAVYVYDRSGALAQRFDASLLDEDSEEEEPFTYERSILPLVKQLVAAKD